MRSGSFETGSFPTRSLLPLQFYLLSLFPKLHSTCRFAHLCRSRPSAPFPISGINEGIQLVDRRELIVKRATEEASQSAEVIGDEHGHPTGGEDVRAREEIATVTHVHDGPSLASARARAGYPRSFSEEI
jgi:hypothetical protein